MNVREQFHRWIDGVDDEDLVKKYFNLILKLNALQEGKLAASLTPSEKEEILKSYEESFDNNHMIANEEVREYFSKWLKK